MTLILIVTIPNNTRGCSYLVKFLSFLMLGTCARVTVVVLSVSVTTLAATYLVYESNLQCYKSIPNV